MLCSLLGLVAHAAENEMESSFCSLVTTSSLMLLTRSVLGTKAKCPVPKKRVPLTQLLDCKPSAHISRVPASAGWLHEAT